MPSLLTDIRPLSARTVSYDSPDLVAWVASRLLPPSTLPYNLTAPHEDSWGQAQQVKVIQALTRNKVSVWYTHTRYQVDLSPGIVTDLAEPSTEPSLRLRGCVQPSSYLA